MRGTRRPLTLLPLLLASFGPARADPYCIPLHDLRAAVTDCSLNNRYPEAAGRCLEKFDLDASGSSRLRLERGLREGAARSTLAQDKKIALHSDDLGQTLFTLRELLKKAAQARKEAQIYGQNFTWPGPLPDSLVRGLGLASLLERIPCYASNQIALQNKMEAWNRRIAELQGASQAAKNMADADATSLTGLSARQRQAMGSGAPKLPVPVPPRKKTGGGASTITGPTDPVRTTR